MISACAMFPPLNLHILPGVVCGLYYPIVLHGGVACNQMHGRVDFLAYSECEPAVNTNTHRYLIINVLFKSESFILNECALSSFQLYQHSEAQLKAGLLLCCS